MLKTPSFPHYEIQAHSQKSRVPLQGGCGSRPSWRPCPTLRSSDTVRTAPQETRRDCPTLASAPPPGHILPLRGLVGLGRLVTGHQRQATPSTPHSHAQVWTCPAWRLCSVTQEPGTEWIQRHLVLWGPRSWNPAPSAWRGHRAPGQSPGQHAFRVGCRAPKGPPDELHGEAEDTLQTSEQTWSLSLAAGGADAGAQMGGLEQASGRGVQIPWWPLSTQRPQPPPDSAPLQR